MKKELLNCVVVSNDFARHAEIDLSCNEWKLLLFMISRIKKHETLFISEEIEVNNVAELFGISTKAIVRRSAEALSNTQISIKDQGVQLFEFIECDKKYIRYKFSEDMREHLLGLEDNMTLLELGRVYDISSKYAIRMYIFGMSFRFCIYYHTSAEDIKRIFNVKLPKSELERRVLTPSLEIINDITNIFLHVRFKDGRYYFCCAEKTDKQKAKYGTEGWKRKIEDVRDSSKIAEELFADLCENDDL